MLSKSHIKLIQSLKLNKFRKQHRLFIAEGPKIVGELLNSNFRIREVYATEEFIHKQKSSDGFNLVTQKELERISLLKSPNQVLALVEIPEEKVPQLHPEELVLVLDGINDPGNMGTILRTADWFGIQKVICSENCAELYNPKVIQATMGSFARISVVYLNLAEFLKRVPSSIAVYGAVLNGSNIYQTQLKSKGLLIIGSESHGISDDVLAFVTNKISIPEFSSSTDKAESLNASVATAILCSEFRRQSKYQ